MSKNIATEEGAGIVEESRERAKTEKEENGGGDPEQELFISASGD